MHHYFSGSPVSQSISAHPTIVTLVNIMDDSHVNRPPHSWDIVISDSDLETPGSRSWVWSRGNVIQSAQYQISSLPFISHQSDQQFLRYNYFEIWSWNIHDQDHEWGHRSMSHIIPSIEPMHFLFVSHQSNQPFLRYGQIMSDLEKTHPKFFWWKFAKITVVTRTASQSNQVTSMTRAMKFPCFVVIRWVVLT